MKVLVTGATGFIGKTLTNRLITEPQISVRAASRAGSAGLPASVEPVTIGDLSQTMDWRRSLSGADVVVHLAGRAHVMRAPSSSESPSEWDDYRRVNVASSLHLARQAAAAGVRRMVFLSSVKVHGERGRFSESDTPWPVDAYGTSKYEAELGLRAISAETGMGLVVIRPPMVYGPGVKANFKLLTHAVARGIPMPFRSVQNRRSFIAVDNLVDFILQCILHPAAPGQTFLVSDGEDLSTPELIHRLASAMGRSPRLIPFPVKGLLASAKLLGRAEMMDRLVSSLQVDPSKAFELLRWTPPVSVDEALRRLALSDR